MGRAFPYRSDCPLPSVGAVSGSLVEDCVVEAVPEMVHSVDFFGLTPIPTFDFGCFCFPEPSVRFSLSNVNSFSAWLTYPSSSETGCCEPQLNFNVIIAARCPSLSTEGLRETWRTRKSTSLTASTFLNEDPCDVNLVFSLGIPASNIRDPQIVRMFYTADNTSSASLLFPPRYSTSTSGGDTWQYSPDRGEYDCVEKIEIPEVKIDFTYREDYTVNEEIWWPCDDGEYTDLVVHNIDEIVFTPTYTPDGVAELELKYTKGKYPNPDDGQWISITADTFYIGYPIGITTEITEVTQSEETAITTIKAKNALYSDDIFSWYFEAEATLGGDLGCNTVEVVLPIYGAWEGHTGCDSWMGFPIEIIYTPQDTWQNNQGDVVQTQYSGGLTGVKGTQVITNISATYKSISNPNRGNSFISAAATVSVERDTAVSFPDGGITKDIQISEDGALGLEDQKVFVFREGLLITTEEEE